MAVVKKISELTPKGSNLANNDLLIVGVDNGTDYDLKSVTGAELLSTAVSQTITNGVTTSAPSQNAVYDALDLKVDKVTGSRLITSAEGTILGNTSGTNSGDETVTTIKSKLGITTLSGSNTGDQDLSGYVKTTTNQTIGGEKTFSSNTVHDSGLKIKHGTSSSGIGYTGIGANENQLIVGTLGASQALTFPNTANYNYTFPSATGTLSLTSDLTSKVDSNAAITGATKTKITYDSKGLVTAGADATTSDIADSSNKRYVTDAQLTVLGNTSGTNTGDQIISDATLTTSDITTNNVSTTKHGFVPKAPNNTTQFLRGDGTWATPSAGGLTYFTEAQNTSAPNATVPVDSLTAVTGTTNGDFAIIPKGTGAIVTAIPDGTATGGNKRGSYSVDLQLYRTSAVQVAQAAYSGLFAGQRNFLGSGQTNCTIIGGNQGSLYGGTDSAMISCSGGELSGSNNVTIGGTSSNNFGQNCLVTGNSNSSSGTSNTLTGAGNQGGGTANLLSGASNTSTGSWCNLSGKLNVSSGKFNLLTGQWGNDFGHTSRFVIGSFQDTGPYTKGISQLSTLVTTYVSTSATAVEMTNFDSPILIALVLQNNNAMRIKGSIIGKQTGSTNVCCYDFDCVIVRGIGVATTILPLSNMNLVLDTISVTTLPSLSANTSLGGLSIKSGGKASTNIRWVARIDSTESILA
jgi:hypothetical protein